MKLTIRKKDRYWQLGYYSGGKWFNEEHLGTAEKLLKLVREAKAARTNGDDVPTSFKKKRVLNEEERTKKTLHKEVLQENAGLFDDLGL